MKSPNKLVASLFVGMLTVSSVCSADSIFSMGRLRSLVNSACDSRAAQVLAGVGRKVIDNPKKTGAVALATIAVGAGYKCWQDPWVAFAALGDAVYSVKNGCDYGINAFAHLFSV